MHLFRRTLRAVTAAGAVTVLALAALGPGTVSAAQPEPPSVKVKAAERAQALRYWSRTRMASARAVPAVRVKGEPTARELARPTGTSHATPGHAPAGAKVDRASSRSETVDPVVGYPYPYPFTRFTVDQSLYPGTWPYITIGKLFFQQRNAAGVLGNYACSAASSAAANVVFTAGHCLNGGPPNPGNRWSQNVIFVPAYENGAQPYGRFACGFKTVATAWFVSGDPARDVGACRVGVSSLAPNKTLTQSVGWLGFAWNQSRFQHWHAFGYPGEPPFNGLLMIVCAASWAVTDGNPAIGAPDPHGIGCDMNRGSSGGPWVKAFKTGNWINGVNSYKYFASQPLAVYSPYFDTYVNQIRCYAATGTWPPPAC